MQFHVDLPTNVEGEWTLTSKDGKVLASSETSPGAQLTVKPYFYKGRRGQIVGRSVTVSNKGNKVRQLLRLSGADGVCRAIQCDKPREIITPKFDEAPCKPEAEEPKKGRK